MANPIGVTFIPNDQNQALGPQQGQVEGGDIGDLGRAFKILSLHLPRVLGASAISSPRLLTSPGSNALPGSVNPAAAVFDALLRAMTGEAPPTVPGANTAGSAFGLGGPGASFAPRVTPGVGPTNLGPIGPGLPRAGTPEPGLPRAGMPEPGLPRAGTPPPSAPPLLEGSTIGSAASDPFADFFQRDPFGGFPGRGPRQV